MRADQTSALIPQNGFILSSFSPFLLFECSNLFIYFYSTFGRSYESKRSKSSRKWQDLYKTFCLKLIIVHLNKSAGIFHLSKGTESLDYVKKNIKKPRKGYFWRRTGNSLPKSQIENISRKPRKRKLGISDRNVFPFSPSATVAQWIPERTKTKEIHCNLHVIVEGNL